MKKVFKNRLEAIDWIAGKAEDEGQFEVLREQLNFNYIYTGRFFINLDKATFEVVMLGGNEEK